MQSFETDVLVVGAGPGGSAAAYHLARHGDRRHGRREGGVPAREGLRRRPDPAVGQGDPWTWAIDTDDPGFEKVIGLRVHARRTTIQLPWPDLDLVPAVRARDAARGLRPSPRAARGEGGRAAARADRGGRAAVRRRLRAPARPCGPRASATRSRPRSARATCSRPTARRAGSRSPPGVRRDPGGRSASRRAATSASTTTRGRGSSRGSTCGTATSCCPGYGWLFPVAGGRINLGAGLLNTFANFKDISAQHLFDAFARMLPPEWGIGEDTAEGRVLSGPLPDGPQPDPAGGAGVAAGRRRRRRGEPVQRRGHRLRDRDRGDRRGAGARGARHRPAGDRDAVPARARGHVRRATSPSGGGSPR